MDNAAAGPSRSDWHTATIRVPFLAPEHATIARRALDVDREQNASFVEREITVEGAELIIQYTTTTVRLLRLSTNTLLSSLDLLVRTMADFAPDPDQPPITDEELERIRIEANKGESKGIELRGDGKGAGSGQEVQ